MTESEAHRSELDGVAGRPTVFLRPIGSPASLGFFGLAAATFVLSGLQLGWVDPAQGVNVAIVLIGFAFVAQLTASVFGFLARDGMVGTAMAVLALNWLVVGAILGTSVPGATSDVLGLFLLVTGTAMALSGTTAALSKLVPACVFLLAAVRFVVSGIYELVGGAAWQDAAGVIGLVLFVVALYAAWAAQLEEAAGRTVLPFGRRGEGKSAVHDGLRAQPERTLVEPGVRSQL